MKHILLLLSLLATFPLHAQDVWKEGTQWMITYEDNEEAVFFLEGKATIEGMEYLALKSVTSEVPDTSLIGYIRTERGDTTVYARIMEEEAGAEFVLYDFGTFEPGTYLQYSETDTVANEIVLHTDVIDADSLTYYHDVIETGDILPCYNNVVFKIGHLGGPMYLIDSYLIPSPFGDKPKRKNISHTVLKLTDRVVELTTDGIRTIKTTCHDNRCHNVQGMCVNTPKKGIHIINGKKYLIRTK